MREAERQRRVVEAMESVRYYSPAPPVWVTKLVGRDFLSDVVDMDSPDPIKVNDRILTNVEVLTELKSLNLSDTRITDSGLEKLRGLKTLRLLALSGTQVTNNGLDHIMGLTRLETLSLHDTEISDAGLEHLKGLTELEYLYLHNTHVTEEGIQGLRKALPDCEISWEILEECDQQAAKFLD
jgi:hypothetical protein